jgi:hypothetical protein
VVRRIETPLLTPLILASIPPTIDGATFRFGALHLGDDDPGLLRTWFDGLSEEEERLGPHRCLVLPK